MAKQSLDASGRFFAGFVILREIKQFWNLDKDENTRFHAPYYKLKINETRKYLVTL